MNNEESRYLFLDNFDLDPGAPGYDSAGRGYRLVPPTENVGLTVQEAEKGEMFLSIDRPWENRSDRLFPVTLLYEDGRYRLWYQTSDPIGGLLCYAESEDGIRWEKPALGQVEVDGSRANNVVLPVAPRVPRIFRDPSADPAERYKIIFGGPEYHPGGGVSPDGLRWTLFENPILDSYCDTWNTACYDEHLDQYVGCFRGYHVEPGRRCIRRAETDDFRQWLEPVVVMAPDSRDPIQDDF